MTRDYQVHVSGTKAEEVERVLSALARDGKSADQPTRYERFVRWAQNHPAVAVILVLGAVVVAVGAVAGAVVSISQVFGLFRTP